MSKRKPLSQLTADNGLQRDKRAKSDDCAPSTSTPRSQRKRHQENSMDNSKQSRKNKEVTPDKKRAGVVSKMVLKNFMCHSHLEVELNSNVNFVIGKNGSGKSAILTGLVLGLGAKSSTTNRGKCITGFIKAGTTSASVEIHLYNQGYMAYMPDVYGKEIIIQRSFTSSGTSRYKIKSETGETVSAATKEIRKICSYFNIQVDNPICILNQDTSRNFLNSSNTKQKYALFEKATRLDELQKEYKVIMSNKSEVVRLLAEKENLLNAFSNDLEKLKQKMDFHHSIISHKRNLSKLQNELQWAKVCGVEEECKLQEAAYLKVEQKMQAVEVAIKNREENLIAMHENIGAIKQQLKELEAEANEQKQRENKVMSVVGPLKEKYTRNHREKQQLGKSIDVKTKEIEEIESQIANYNSKLMQIEEEKTLRAQEIAGLEEKYTSMSNMLGTTQNEQFQFQNALKMKAADSSTLQNEITQLQQQYRSIEQNMALLKVESNNNVLLYGAEMPHVLKAIEANAHKFVQLPRGPLGLHIKLKDKKWAVAVEGFLSPKLLRSFCVDNKNDNALLMSILKKAYSGKGYMPTIITSKFLSKMHNIADNLVASKDGCISVYEAIEVRDPVVANCLIDQACIENVLLIPNTDKAIELMSEEAQVPRNCKRGITMVGDQYYPDPNYKSYGSRYHHARYLQVDAKQLICDLEKKAHNLSVRKEAVQNQLKAVDLEVYNDKSVLNQLTEKLQKLNEARAVVRKKVDELNSAVDSEIGDVQCLEIELLEIKRILEEDKCKFNAAEEALKVIEGDLEESQDQLKSCRETSAGMSKRMSPLENQIREHQTKLHELSLKEDFEKRRLQEFTTKTNEAKVTLLEMQTAVQEATEEAEQFGERIVIKRPMFNITSEIKETQGIIAKIESDVADPKQLKIKYLHSRDKYLEAQGAMKILSSNVHQLQELSNNKKKLLKHAEKYFVYFINHSFKNTLECNNYQGSLDIDIKEKNLNMVVVPQNSSKSLTTLANLSGGERSFSTVAFLYSLWQCMDFPFYFLDEFDVFMDKNNRAKVMEILIHHAKSKSNLQFVFLTPQDMSFLTDKEVAVHRLDDPVR